jgi:hypothetical protein
MLELFFLSNEKFSILFSRFFCYFSFILGYFEWQVVLQGLLEWLVLQCDMVTVHHLVPTNMNRGQLKTQQLVLLVFHLGAHTLEQFLPARAKQARLTGLMQVKLDSPSHTSQTNYLLQ